MIRSILMVCTANICRSPLAEYEMRRLAPDIHISSAGTSALVGSKADTTMLDLASKKGIDLSSHRSRQVCEEIIFEHDIVLVMDASHYKWMRDAFPQDRAKILKMCHWSGGHDIPDPYRRSLAVYDAVYKKIRQGCVDWSCRLGLAEL